MFAVLARYDTWTIGTQAVVFFLLALLAGVFLARLGVLVGRQARQMAGKIEGQRSPIGQLIFVISRFMIGASILGIVLGLAGLTRAGGYLITSTSKTVFLIAFLLVAQRLIQKIFAAIEGRNDDESSLAAVLVGSVMVVASLPLLALTWGARSSDLSEMGREWPQGCRW